MSWPAGRTKPYTSIGIKRVKCIRCGSPADSQWQICADGGKHRPLCNKCDTQLNALVLKWAGDPDANMKMQRYKD